MLSPILLDGFFRSLRGLIMNEVGDIGAMAI